jgi:hypothetical protein
LSLYNWLELKDDSGQRQKITLFFTKKDVENRVPLIQISDNRVFNIFKDVGNGEQVTKTGTEDDDDQWSERSFREDLLDKENCNLILFYYDLVMTVIVNVI